MRLNSMGRAPRGLAIVPDSLPSARVRSTLAIWISTAMKLHGVAADDEVFDDEPRGILGAHTGDPLRFVVPGEVEGEADFTAIGVEDALPVTCGVGLRG